MEPLRILQLYEDHLYKEGMQDLKKLKMWKYLKNLLINTLEDDPNIYGISLKDKIIGLIKYKKLALYEKTTFFNIFIEAVKTNIYHLIKDIFTENLEEFKLYYITNLLAKFFDLKSLFIPLICAKIMMILYNKNFNIYNIEQLVLYSEEVNLELFEKELIEKIKECSGIYENIYVRIFLYLIEFLRKKCGKDRGVNIKKWLDEYIGEEDGIEIFDRDPFVMLCQIYYLKKDIDYTDSEEEEEEEEKEKNMVEDEIEKMEKEIRKELEGMEKERSGRSLSIIDVEGVEGSYSVIDLEKESLINSEEIKLEESRVKNIYAVDMVNLIKFKEYKPQRGLQKNNWRGIKFEDLDQENNWKIEEKLNFQDFY